MEKVYQLPDIMPAAPSDLQALVRRLLEYADWSVLPPLLDEIRAQGREREVRWLQGAIASHLCSTDLPRRYQTFVTHVLSIYWFDLFDVADTARAMAQKPFTGEQRRNGTARRPTEQLERMVEMTRRLREAQG